MPGLGLLQSCSSKIRVVGIVQTFYVDHEESV